MNRPSLLHPLKNLGRYKEINRHLIEDNRKRDRFMLYLILLHWLVALLVTSHPYDTYLLGFVGGGVLFLISLLAYRFYQTRRIFRMVAAFSLMNFSAIYIQQHLGHIELHFHVFVALAFLTIYKDFIPLLFGAAYSILYHILFNYLQSIGAQLFDTPLMIFSYGTGYDIVLLHSLFVVFETMMLLYITGMRQLSFSNVINTSQQLEYLNTNLEKEIQKKTGELRQTVEKLEKTNGELVEAKNKALGAIEARSNFISSISHELRTPLHSVINFTDMVLEDYERMFRDESVKKDNREFLERSLKNSRHLLSLINDILEYTKTEAGKMTYDLVPTDINPLVRNAFVNAQSLLNNAPIDPRMLLSDRPLIATVDKRRFFQLLLNIISNAVKFTQKGHITVRTYEKEGKIYVDIEDSGRGIPEEKLETIFDPFAQVTHYDPGTGLGLVIVKKMCEDMHIDLSLESQVEVGTRFTLTLEKSS